LTSTALTLAAPLIRCAEAKVTINISVFMVVSILLDRAEEKQLALSVALMY